MEHDIHKGPNRGCVAFGKAQRHQLLCKRTTQASGISSRTRIMRSEGRPATVAKACVRS